jgi:hypothetical protein
MVTRRAILTGGSAFVAAAQWVSARAQPALYVRQSLATLVRQRSPRLDALRRGVDAMMRLPTWDKRNWWFQANIFAVADAQVPPEMRPFAARFFNASPFANYFVPTWRRMYLYHVERILRALSGDPGLTLPYWSYDDPQNSQVPTPFQPDRTEVAVSTPVNAYARRNPLARALRHPAVDLGIAELRPDIARQCAGLAQLDVFASTDAAAPNASFGGMVARLPREQLGIGGLEAVNNAVHGMVGLGTGDMASPLTAARDPLFLCHLANIDRLWTKWIDPARTRELPTQDATWMNATYPFINEAGQETQISAAYAVDNQYQLYYRYEDEPERPRQYLFNPGSGRARLVGDNAPAARVVARAPATTITARETHAALAPLAAMSVNELQTSRLSLVVRGAAAADRCPPYAVRIAAGTAAPLDIGMLALFGAPTAASGGGLNFTFDITSLVLRLSRTPGFDPGKFTAVFVRRGLIDASGQDIVANDGVPLRIGAVELVKT